MTETSSRPRRTSGQILAGTAVALAVGIGVVMLAVEGLEKLAGDSNGSAAETAYIVHLPQDEEMLKELSRQLMAGTDVEGDVSELNDIAPAAGQPLASPPAK